MRKNHDLTEREEQALALYEAGMNYAEIARYMMSSRNRARELVKAAQHQLRMQLWLQLKEREER